MSKIKVAILYGGRSTEHEISLLSAQHIYKSLDSEKYEAVLIGIDKSGRWFYQEDSLRLMHHDDPAQISLSNTTNEVLFSQNTDDHYLLPTSKTDSRLDIDVLFPVLHGSYGEDGSIQGLARMANVPCVGPGTLGSAVGMDKEVMKRLLRDAGIKSAPWVTIRRRDIDKIDIDMIVDQLGEDVFVKPVNLGSSVGISHVKSSDQLAEAIQFAFKFDHKVIIEQRIHGREIECAVLGNDNPMASVPGEVIPKDGFYSYEAKYIDEHGATLVAPADLSENEVAKIKELSIRTFTLLECYGLARVDMFLTIEGELYINEINTLPGFTSISMFPTLWELSGIPQKELVDRLIQLAIEKHDQDSALQTEM